MQLFRERFSYNRGKAFATMSKVIIGDGGFYCCLSETQGVSAWWKETVQTGVFMLIKQSLKLTTHDANRHCILLHNTRIHAQ